MVIIGLAGESGTGKSTIGRYLAEKYRGIHIDADLVGHDLLESDEVVISAVRAIAGDAVFGADGKISRRALGAFVFGDAEALQRYNAVIHPAIRRRCGELVKEAQEGGARIAAVDAALLLDSSMPFEFDLMIALKCDRDIQVSRLIEKGGRTDDEIRARLRNQQHIEKSFYKADTVVDTGVKLTEMLARILAVTESVMGSEDSDGEV